ncbi:hypothetical protein [Pseudomonas sp. QD4]|uniref:hypothetical protein n=1 Tax=Pseudomonas sp. QD4 TaxID=3368618 RepID=UPI003BA26CBF
MIKVVEYCMQTGEIYRVIDFWDKHIAQRLYPEALIVSSEVLVTDELHIVVGGVVVNRPMQSVTVEGRVLKGVVKGAKLFIDDSIYEADGTDIELEFDLEKTHYIKICIWPYVDEGVFYENKTLS